MTRKQIDNISDDEAVRIAIANKMRIGFSTSMTEIKTFARKQLRLQNKIKSYVQTTNSKR